MRKSAGIAALAAAGLMAAGVAAPSAAAPSKKGTTTVTFKAETLALLTAADGPFGFTGISPTGAGSASVEGDGDLAAVFGIVGRPGAADIKHVGGLELAKGSTTAVLSNFIITEEGFVSGIVNDSFRTDLFEIGGASDDGVALEVTKGAAELLTAVFGIPDVEGFPLAYGKPMPITK